MPVALAVSSKATVQLPAPPSQPLASTSKLARFSSDGLAATVASLRIVQE